MDNNERELFNQLIAAAGELATVADQAGSTLSTDFEDMCTPSIERVRAILDKCPSPEGQEWDGELRKDDLKIETFRTDTQAVNESNVGVKIIHLPTGIGRTSKTKPSQLENREVAIKALREAVNKEYASRG